MVYKQFRLSPCVPAQRFGEQTVGTLAAAWGVASAGATVIDVGCQVLRTPMTLTPAFVTVGGRTMVGAGTFVGEAEGLAGSLGITGAGVMMMAPSSTTGTLWERAKRFFGRDKVKPDGPTPKEVTTAPAEVTTAPAEAAASGQSLQESVDQVKGVAAMIRNSTLSESAVPLTPQGRSPVKQAFLLTAQRELGMSDDAVQMLGADIDLLYAHGFRIGLSGSEFRLFSM